jgi:hypothetical protein
MFLWLRRRGTGAFVHLSLVLVWDFRAVCSRMPQSVPRLVTCLNQYGTSNFEPQRIVVTTFYAEVCFHTPYPLTLCDCILHCVVYGLQ